MSAKLDRNLTNDEAMIELLNSYEESIPFSNGMKDKSVSISTPPKLFFRLSSTGQQLMIRHPILVGGKYMMFVERFLKPLLDGKVNEVYATWVPDT